MKEQNIFIGVDGGATKSKVIIEDETGNSLGQARGAAASIRYGSESAWRAILASIHQALAQSNIRLGDEKYKFHAGIGVAGCEIASQLEDFRNASHPFSTLVVIPDSYAACLGAHSGKDGAIIIIGTGVVGFQIQENKTMQISGWGFPYDDQGGGAWLGLRAIEMTLKWLDGRIQQESNLFHTIFEKFNKDLNRLITWATSANSTSFAEIAPLVLRHLEEKDPLAVVLIQEAARHVDLIGDALIKRSEGQKSLPCSLFGGIAPYVQPWLGESLLMRITEREKDDTHGAIFALKRKMIENGTLSKVGIVL